MRKQSLLWGVASVTGMMILASASFADETVYTLTIKNHQFSPAELKIPANKKVRIVVENQDLTAEEFESYELNREKLVAGNGRVNLFVGPLKPGTYRYFGEFNPKTAQGTIVAE